MLLLLHADAEVISKLQSAIIDLGTENSSERLQNKFL